MSTIPSSTDTPLLAPEVREPVTISYIFTKVWEAVKTFFNYIFPCCCCCAAMPDEPANAPVLETTPPPLSAATELLQAMSNGAAISPAPKEPEPSFGTYDTTNLTAFKIDRDLMTIGRVPIMDQANRQHNEFKSILEEMQGTLFAEVKSAHQLAGVCKGLTELRTSYLENFNTAQAEQAKWFGENIDAKVRNPEANIIEKLPEPTLEEIPDHTPTIQFWHLLEAAVASPSWGDGLFYLKLALEGAGDQQLICTEKMRALFEKFSDNKTTVDLDSQEDNTKIFIAQFIERIDKVAAKLELNNLDISHVPVGKFISQQGNPTLFCDILVVNGVQLSDTIKAVACVSKE